jgi:hypothetical protein
MGKDLKNHFLKEKIDNIILQYCYLIEKKFKSNDKLKNISFI